MAIDLGTGPGRAVLRQAAREPGTLFIGVDADAAAMAEGSRRAARPAGRGGRPNVLFIAAAAESLPGVLCGRADVVTVALPWGSLLRGLIGADGRLLAAIASTLRPGGELELLLSTVDRDGLGSTLDDAAVERLADAYGPCGFRHIESRPALLDDVERLSSGWGRRLGIPEKRPAWLLRFGYAGVAGASVFGAAGGVSAGGVSAGSSSL